MLRLTNRANSGIGGVIMLNPFSLIRTMTVGSGVTPDLLDPHFFLQRDEALAGFLIVGSSYRRWGVSPRPEKVSPLRYFNSGAVFSMREGN